KTKRTSERLGRRKETLLKKAHEMAKFCDIDVALTLRIRKTGRYITYKSMDLESWPPSKKQIAIAHCISRSLALLTENWQLTYPLPLNLLPHNIERTLR
ncbi:hypothetical protein OIDMADRAFT_110392, partial [Oidiodendron maius Zn]